MDITDAIFTLSICFSNCHLYFRMITLISHFKITKILHSPIYPLWLLYFENLYVEIIFFWKGIWYSQPNIILKYACNFFTKPCYHWIINSFFTWLIKYEITPYFKYISQHHSLACIISLKLITGHNWLAKMIPLFL